MITNAGRVRDQWRGTGRMSRHSSVRTIAIAAAAAAVLALTACVGGAPTPVETDTSSSSAEPTPGASAPPGGAALRPGESAAANHEFFDAVNEALYATAGMSDGRTIVDNLVSNGFVKTDIEVTFDTTALELAVDSIQVSVRINDECLVGGFSPAGYSSIKAPVLGTGKCLIGTTRPIDW